MHSVLWLRDRFGNEAPSFWNEDFFLPVQSNEDMEEGKKKIKTFAESIVCT